MCQTLLSGANDQVTQGMLRSAFFLMAMPFLVFGAIGGWIFYNYRKMNRTKQTNESRQPLSVLANKKEEPS